MHRAKRIHLFVVNHPPGCKSALALRSVNTDDDIGPDQYRQIVDVLIHIGVIGNNNNDGHRTH